MHNTILMFFLVISQIAYSVDINGANMLENSPSYCYFNPAETAVNNKGIVVQLVYENRFFQKDLSVKLIGVQKAGKRSNFNFLFSQMGNKYYQEYLTSLNASMMLHEKISLGCNLNAEIQYQSNRQKNKFKLYPSIGIQVALSELSTVFSNVTFSTQQANSFYNMNLGYNRIINKEITAKVFISSTEKRVINAHAQLTIKSYQNNKFYLQIGSSQYPMMLGYQLRWKSLDLSFGFWYHMILGLSNHVAVNYNIGK